jgi:hypothetical protein
MERVGNLADSGTRWLGLHDERRNADDLRCEKHGKQWKVKSNGADGQSHPPL